LSPIAVWHTVASAPSGVNEISPEVKTLSTDALRPLVAFLGPSLHAEVARSIVPDIELLPPICQGDLASVVEHLRPRAVLIVDGEFGQSLSVWHKEILAALRDGTRVVGASSMGALRAAELNRYGMEGVGEIYTYFRDGWMTDDADVALLHADADSGYQSLTLPLVNVRATTAALCRGGTIEPRDAAALLGAAGAIHFTERNQATLQQQLAADGMSADAARRLVEEFVAGYVDQKASDAAAAFEYLSRIGSIPHPESDEPLYVDVHTYISMRDSDVTVGPKSGNLRRYQLVNDVALHDADFDQLLGRAVERDLLNSLVDDFNIEITPDELVEQRRRTLAGLDIPEESLPTWLADNDLDAARFDRLIQQQAVVSRFHQWALDIRPFDHGRELVIEQLQLEGKYAAATDAAARRHAIVASSPPAPYPRTSEEVRKLVIRHSLRTGWKPRTDLTTWSQEHCFDEVATLLVALADADTAHTVLAERRARIARLLGIETAVPTKATVASTTEARATMTPPKGPTAPAMPSIASTAPTTTPGSLAHGLLDAHQFSQVVIAAVELGIPQALRVDSASAAELASAIGADPARLARFLRALEAVGVVVPDEARQWTLTATGRALVSADADHAAHADRFGLDWYARYLRVELMSRWASLAAIVRGADPPAYPDDELTDRAIAGLTVAHDHADAIARSFEASPGARVVDIGGGLGLFAEALHTHRPDLSVGVVELPGTAARAVARLTARGLGDAIDVTKYEGQPQLDRLADRCILVRVLNNLADGPAVELLRFARRSLAPGGTVDVIEVHDDGSPIAGLGDLLNLVRTGGAVRDTEGWHRLAEQAGLRLIDVVPVLVPFARARFALPADEEPEARADLQFQCTGRS